MSEEEEQSRSQRKRRVTKRKSKKGSLYSKREQLLKEMQMTDDSRSIGVREQLEKLKSAQSNPDGTADEDGWGSKEKRKRGSRWILWAVLGLIIPVILVGLVLMTSKGSRKGKGYAGETGLNFDALSGQRDFDPQDWFVENSGEAFSTVVEVLEKLSAEELTVEEVASVVRSEDQAAYLLQLHEEGSWSAFDTSEPSSLTWEYGSAGDTGFMAVSGVRADFRKFRAYFVKEEDGLFMDVEASVARSDIPIVELPAKQLSGEVLLRCWVAKEPHFDAGKNKDSLSFYQILSPDEIDFVWAYCELGSPLDEQLREELNYGRLLGERKKQFRATIKIGKAREGQGLSDDEFFFEDLLATDWVLPSSQK